MCQTSHSALTLLLAMSMTSTNTAHHATNKAILSDKLSRQPEAHLAGPSSHHAVSPPTPLLATTSTTTAAIHTPSTPSAAAASCTVASLRPHGSGKQCSPQAARPALHHPALLYGCWVAQQQVLGQLGHHLVGEAPLTAGQLGVGGLRSVGGWVVPCVKMCRVCVCASPKF